VNAASGAVECNNNMCDFGYGIKNSDKTCTGPYYSYIIFSSLFYDNLAYL